MKNNRRGIQLLELVISLASASILMVGLSSAMIISTQSMRVATTRHSASSKTQAGLDRLRYDLGEAFRTTSRSANSVSLSVSDRNGDSVRESVQYRWLGGAGTPLQMAVNSGAWTNVTENLNSFQMNWRTSQPQRSAIAGNLDPTGSLVFQTYTTAAGLLSSSLTIPLPETYLTGDLLVAAVAISGDALSASTSAAWQVGPRQAQSTNVTLVTFYSLAPAINSITVSWSGLRTSYGVVSQFSTPGGTATLASSQFFSGTSSSPLAPSATASANNSLVIRMLAGKGLSVVDETCNMPGHVALAMRRSALVDPIVGMAYRYYGPGVVSDAAFNLISSTNYATATMVFQP